MDALLSTTLIGAGAVFAGFLGSLTGLGGGIVIVPLLTVGFGVDIRYAIGVSLVSVIATSSVTAASYVKGGFSNIRIGMFLEIAATTGALGGAFLALHLPTALIAVIFGAVIIYSLYLSGRRKDQEARPGRADPLAVILKMDGAYPAPEGVVPYKTSSVNAGFCLASIGGIISGLLGIGGGAVNVLAMNQVMRLPFKVSTATSNFMMGVTAAASAGIYFKRGYIDPVLAMPAVLGIIAGSTAGARCFFGARTKTLRVVFNIVVFLLGAEMIYSGIKSGFLK